MFTKIAIPPHWEILTAALARVARLHNPTKACSLTNDEDDVDGEPPPVASSRPTRTGISARLNSCCTTMGDIEEVNDEGDVEVAIEGDTAILVGGEGDKVAEEEKGWPGTDAVDVESIQRMAKGGKTRL